MRLTVRNQPDFWAGALFIGVGLAFGLGARHYPMGQASRMGAGYFPALLGLCLALLGLALAVQACRPAAPRASVRRPDWRVAGIVLGAVCLFAALLPVLGVLPSVFILVFVGSMAGHDFDWRVAALVGLGMMAFVWLVFIQGLGLVFPAGVLG
ncbi:tripartite tricarboxylate transporter TctB family protein [uncultured Castellaniella sp.]|uniref:tripartite tricarboxylate transporter TctB family protein n=1 Tax=uncultured Castellaniella sp. TaxID=647907 RepID=UPI0026168FDF|nr:tripartite tricarboxylate transporter TctB family protein [uncultured Castellaniella sp.]